MLRKDKLQALLTLLQARYRIYAPVVRAREVRFDRLLPDERVSLDYRNTPKAPKNLFFPQKERMLRFASPLDTFDRVLDVPVDATPSLVVGLRPCDARGLLLLDRVFVSDAYVDPYYRARRENTMVFSLACDHPRQTCFCHAFDSGPYDRAGADVFMRDAGEDYIVEATSVRGEELLASLTLEPVDNTRSVAAVGIQTQSERSLAEVEPVRGVESWLQSLFDNPVWAQVAEKCLACGTCTYACPGCHCFNIEDRVQASGGERVRAWDGCMYPMFTAHASGHNPRPDQAARWRQRTLHKFAYLPQNVSLYGCVGCGRCIVSCPVRLDIRDVLRRVREAYAAKVQA